MIKKSIAFKTTDGLMIRGFVYLPEKLERKWPAIIMTHGFSGIKEQGLEKFAEKFVTAGFAVLLYDNRHFGDSDGQPRQHIDVIQQRRDYRDAITFLSLQENIDANRIGVWGTSLSGSNALAVAAQDRRVKACVAQVPATQYWLERQQYLLPAEKNRLNKQLIEDRVARMQGAPYRTIKVVDPDKSPAAFGSDPRSIAFFMSHEKWINEITVASLDSLIEYDIENLMDKIAPTPVLLIATSEDQLVPIQTVLKAYAKALEPKALVLLKGDHFSVYYEDENFTKSADQATQWFSKYL